MTKETSFGEFSGQDQIEQKPGETPKDTSFESFANPDKERYEAEDKEMATKAMNEALTNFPEDWQKNSWTYAIYKTSADWTMDQWMDWQIDSLKELDAKGMATEEDKGKLKKLENVKIGQKMGRANKDIIEASKPQRKSEGVLKDAWTDVKAAKEEISKHPRTAAVIMAKLMLYDAPAMIALGWADAPAAVARMADVTVQTARILRAMEAAGLAEKNINRIKLGAQVTEGVGFGAAGQAAQEYQEKGHVDPNEVAKSAVIMGTLDPLLRLGLGGIKRMVKGDPGKMKPAGEWEKEEPKKPPPAGGKEAEMHAGMSPEQKMREFDKAAEEDARAAGKEPEPKPEEAKEAKRGKGKKKGETEDSKRREADDRAAREVLDDERDWGLYNTAVEDYEAVQPHSQKIVDSINDSLKAGEDVGEHFKKTEAPQPGKAKKAPPKELVKDEEALEIARKKASERTPEERKKLKRWQLQALLVTGGLGVAWHMADDETKDQLISTAKAGGVVGAMGIIPGFVLKSPKVVRGMLRESGRADQWIQDLRAAVNKGEKSLAEELRYNEGMDVLYRMGDDKRLLSREQVAEILQNGIKMDEAILGSGTHFSEIQERYNQSEARLKRLYGEHWIGTAPPEEFDAHMKIIMEQPTFQSTQWGQSELMNTPGGTNPKEFLIYLPGSPGIVEGTDVHFPGKMKDMGIFLRTNERLDAEGNRILFVEEIQSDFANRINKDKKRVKSAEEVYKIMEERYQVTKDPRDRARLSQQRETVEYEKERLQESQLKYENTPFVHDTEAWQSLGVRRLLRYAVDEGFDKIAFAGQETLKQRTGKEFPEANEKILRRTLGRIANTLGGKESEIAFNRGGERSVSVITRYFQRAGYEISYHPNLPGDKVVIKTLGGTRQVSPEAIPESLKPMLAEYRAQGGRGPVDEFGRETGAKPPPKPFKTFGMDLPKEVREKIGTGFHLFNREGGKANADLLALMAAAGLGALIGYNFDEDEKLKNMLIGIGVGIGAKAVGKFSAEKLTNAWRSGAKEDRVRITDVIGEQGHFVMATAREVSQLIRGAIDAAANMERRKAMSRALDGDKTVLLNQREAEALLKVKEAFTKFTDMAQELGILDDVRKYYLEKMFDLPGQDPKKLADFFTKIKNKEIGFAFLGEGQKAGLRARTEDVAQIVGMFGDAVGRSIANKRALKALENEGRYFVEGTPIPLVVDASAKNLPREYKSIDQPMLRGKMVHPDIVPELSMLFDTKDPKGWQKMLGVVNMTSKRLRVSLSLFHAMALTQAMIGAGVFAAAGYDPKTGAALGLSLTMGRRLARAAPGYATLGAVGAGLGAMLADDPVVGAEAGFATALFVPAVTKSASMMLGTHSMIHQIRTGGAGDIVDNALRDGVKISFERDLPVVGDVHQDFYAGMQSAQAWVDHYVHPIAGKPIGWLNDLNHTVDNAMWGRLHAGLKIQTYADAKARILKKNIKAHDKSPDIPLMSDEEAGRIAADYTNSLFGGLNWVKIAEGFQSKNARQLAAAMTSQSGLRWLNIAQFAPDWTVATTQSALRAFDPRGMVWGRGTSRGDLANLHRGYYVRAALWTALATEAITYSQTGQHSWETDDPTVAHFEDGSTMQVSKHFNEHLHWLPRELTTEVGKLAGSKTGWTATGKGMEQELNKLGFIPREAIKQTFGVKRLHTDVRSMMGKENKMEGVTDRVASVAENFKPFSVQMDETDPSRMLWGALGLTMFPPKQKKKKKRAEDYIDDALKQ